MEKMKNFITKIKNTILKDYYNLTMYYMVIHVIITSIVVYGIDYLIHGQLNYDSVRNSVEVVGLSLLFTMGKIVKKLKEDITSNYWKQQRQINLRRKK
jgi:hypothetical protein